MRNPFRKRATEPEPSDGTPLSLEHLLTARDRLFAPESGVAEDSTGLPAAHPDSYAAALNRALAIGATLGGPGPDIAMDATDLVRMEPDTAPAAARGGIVEPIPQIITTDWLRRHGACGTGRADFARLWPDGMPLTRTALQRCHDFGLEIDWAVGALPPKWQQQRVAALDRQRRIVRKAERKANARYAAASKVAEEQFVHDLDTIILNFAAASRDGTELS